MNEMSSPKQYEIDAVAYFVEAARELRASPFFIEEYGTIGVSINLKEQNKKNLTAQFPNPHIVTAVLVPFRRLWLQDEPCNYKRVVNILKRYDPGQREFLDSITFDDKSFVFFQTKFFNDCKLSPCDVINIWLNTRYHHVGQSKCGKFTRNDFDTFNNDISPGRFELCFLLAVYGAGKSFINILLYAEVFLESLSKKGLKPSFVLEYNLSEDNIIRKTCGFSCIGDTPEQRVWRLRRRNAYAGLAQLLTWTDISDLSAAQLLESCLTFDEFADKCGISLRQTENNTTFYQDNFTELSACIGHQVPAKGNDKCWKGLLKRYEDGKLICTEDYVPIIRAQYVRFRNAFLKEPFV